MQNSITSPAALQMLAPGAASQAALGAPAGMAGATLAMDFATLMQGAQPVGSPSDTPIDPEALALLQNGEAALSPEDAAALLMGAGATTIATQSGGLSIDPLSTEVDSETADTGEGDPSTLMQQLMAAGEASRNAIETRGPNSTADAAALAAKQATARRNSTQPQIAPTADTDATADSTDINTPTQTNGDDSAMRNILSNAQAVGLRSGRASQVAVARTAEVAAPHMTDGQDITAQSSIQAQSVQGQSVQAQTAIARIAQAQAQVQAQVQTQLQAQPQVQAPSQPNAQPSPNAQSAAQVDMAAITDDAAATVTPNVAQTGAFSLRQVAPSDTGSRSAKSAAPLTEAAYDPAATDPLNTSGALKTDLKTELKAALSAGNAQTLTTATVQTQAQTAAQAQTQINLQNAADQPAALAQNTQTQAANAAESAQPQPPAPQPGAMARSLLMTDREWPTQLTAMMKEARDLTQGDIEIALQPERLGRMTIRMEMRENAVAVTIVTDNDASARLLNDNQARLADLMAKAGLDLSQHNASSGQQGGAQAGLGGQGGNGAPGQGQSGDTNTLATAQVLGGEAGQMNTAGDDDGIDILA
jgi:flagellar hook-length control protein FliK